MTAIVGVLNTNAGLERFAYYPLGTSTFNEKPVLMAIGSSFAVFKGI